MKTVVETIKGKIEYSGIDLDVKYINQTEKMLTESSAGQEYYSGKKAFWTFVLASGSSKMMKSFLKNCLYLNFLTF